MIKQQQSARIKCKNNLFKPCVRSKQPRSIKTIIYKVFECNLALMSTSKFFDRQQNWGKQYSYSLHAMETGICHGWIGLLAQYRLMSLKKGNICLLVMTHRTHCPRSTRHEFGPNNVVSHLALPLSQVFFTKVFSTINNMPPSAGEVDHSCPCGGLIIHTFRASPSSHDIVARGHSLCFLGRRESLSKCRGTPRLFYLKWHFLCWAGVRIFCLCTLSRWICVGLPFLVIQ